MAYATPTDVAQYTGIAEADLPEDIERLIERASEMMDQATLRRIRPENERHAEAARDAVCAQLEFWFAVDEDRDIEGPVQGVILGRLQIQYGAGTNRITPTYLAPRAKRHLFLAGLLYQGVATL